MPFRYWHLQWLVTKGSPADGVMRRLSEGEARALENHNCWTGVVDGEVVACAGTIEQWRGRHTAWAYLNDATGPLMRWITRETRRVLDGVKGRIEFSVRKDFEAGHRWAKLLGFEVETPLLRAYGPMGEDHTAYVRIN